MFRYIEPVLFLYSFTLYLNIPTEKQLIYRKVCLSHYNQTFCASLNGPRSPPSPTPLPHNHSRLKSGTHHQENIEENIVQAGSAKWDMYCNIARLLPTLISTVYVGAWSDGVGRRKVSLIFSSI